MVIMIILSIYFPILSYALSNMLKMTIKNRVKILHAFPLAYFVPLLGQSPMFSNTSRWISKGWELIITEPWTFTINQE